MAGETLPVGVLMTQTESVGFAVGTVDPGPVSRGSRVSGEVPGGDAIDDAADRVEGGGLDLGGTG